MTDFMKAMMKMNNETVSSQQNAAPIDKQLFSSEEEFWIKRWFDKMKIFKPKIVGKYMI